MTEPGLGRPVEHLDGRQLALHSLHVEAEPFERGVGLQREANAVFDLHRRRQRLANRYESSPTAFFMERSSNFVCAGAGTAEQPHGMAQPARAQNRRRRVRGQERRLESVGQRARLTNIAAIRNQRRDSNCLMISQSKSRVRGLSRKCRESAREPSA